MVECPTPTRPCRRIPERKPTAIATSLRSSVLNRSARIVTFRERELVRATLAEAATTSASRVMACVGVTVAGPTRGLADRYVALTRWLADTRDLTPPTR